MTGDKPANDSSVLGRLPTPTVATRLGESNSVPDSDSAHALDYVSASRLKCWQTCRRQYYYRYVRRIEVPLAPALFVGARVHEVLSTWYRARWGRSAIDPERLEAVFLRRWETGQRKEIVAWKNEEQERESRVRTWALIEHYLARSPVPAAEKPQGVEVEVECDLGDRGLPPLFGYIDLVRGNGRIVELKTASRRSDPSMLAHQHGTQLTCYALAYRSATGIAESGFEIHNLIKTRIPQVEVVVLDPMSPAQESGLFRLIEAFLAGLEHEEWILSPGPHCHWCDYLERCRSDSSMRPAH